MLLLGVCMQEPQEAPTCACREADGERGLLQGDPWEPPSIGGVENRFRSEESPSMREGASAEGGGSKGATACCLRSSTDGVASRLSFSVAAPEANSASSTWKDALSVRRLSEESDFSSSTRSAAPDTEEGDGAFTEGESAQAVSDSLGDGALLAVGVAGDWTEFRSGRASASAQKSSPSSSAEFGAERQEFSVEFARALAAPLSGCSTALAFSARGSGLSPPAALSTLPLASAEASSDEPGCSTQASPFCTGAERGLSGSVSADSGAAEGRLNSDDAPSPTLPRTSLSFGGVPKGLRTETLRGEAKDEDECQRRPIR